MAAGPRAAVTNDGLHSVLWNKRDIVLPGAFVRSVLWCDQHNAITRWEHWVHILQCPRVKCHNVHLTCFCTMSSGTCQGLEVLWQSMPVPVRTAHCSSFPSLCLARTCPILSCASVGVYEANHNLLDGVKPVNIKLS